VSSMQGNPPFDASDERPIVAFDFDGTITTQDTLRLFLTRIRSRRSLAATFARRSPQLAGALRGGGARDRAKKVICLDVLRGLDRGHAEAAAAETAGVIERSLIRGDTAARLRWHQAEGHRVMFVSASFEAYVRLVAAAFEVHEVIATRWEVDPASDTLMGGLVGPNVRGDAKVDLIAEWIKGPCRLEYAYGNSSGDTAMLAHAKHPVWVGRRQIPELRQKPPGGDRGR
jgi:phosphatidylglycerophosphatase C